MGSAHLMILTTMETTFLQEWQFPNLLAFSSVQPLFEMPDKETDYIRILSEVLAWNDLFY